MKFKIGDILRSKDDMRITILNGKNEEGCDEDVEQGEYFIITDYGEYEDQSDTRTGWTLLSQKNASRSRWDESYCDLDKSFTKV